MTAEPGERPDVVPYTLGDLSDVQSTGPSVGDALRWDGTQWTPGSATCENGPMVSIFAGTKSSPGVGTNQNLTEIPDNDYANWAPWTALQEVDDAPGEWVLGGGGQAQFQFSRAGLYSVRATYSATVSGALDPDCYLFCSLSFNSVHVPGFTSRIASPSNVSFIGSSVGTPQFRVTQDAIDNHDSGFPPHFYPYWVYVRPTGTVTMTEMYVETQIWQWLPDDHDPTWTAI